MSSNDPLNQITALSCPSRENQARGKQSKPRGAPTGAKSNLAPIFLFPIPQNRQDTADRRPSWQTVECETRQPSQDSFAHDSRTILLYFHKNPGTTFSGSLCAISKKVSELNKWTFSYSTF
ncbi:hypothetical protein [Flagellimonas sp. S3867]|uniref:hypothetical protein n=2 Tax=Flagellimonas sp. S3867 TaxID=2768063 RepID=UPI00168A3933|nr:hypothetical protein [Flagellimonas sp. S3867]